jgi:uncharacterized protein
MDADDIIRALKLSPLPEEGGYYRETYRAEDTIDVGAIPAGRSGPKSFGTAIYYLLTPDTFSALHRLPSDEIYHFYAGDPVEMLQLGRGGGGRLIVIGDFLGGFEPQVVAPRGVWQGSRLLPGGRFALLGTTVAPGFDFTDYEGGRRSDLERDYPAFKDRIRALTRV